MKGEKVISIIDSLLRTGFVNVQFVAEGELGYVYRAKYSNEDVAVKVRYITQVAESLDAAVSQLAHVNLIPVLESGRLDDEYRYQVMPWASHTLAQMRLDLDALRLLQVGSRVANALEYLHSQGYVYGDVKPENILLQMLPVETIGFVWLGDRESISHPGPAVAYTPLYAAPEVVDPPRQVTAASDVYSLAVTLLRTSGLRLPPRGTSYDPAWVVALITGYTANSWQRDLAQLYIAALSVSVTQRPSAQEFGLRLQQIAQVVEPGLPAFPPLTPPGRSGVELFNPITASPTVIRQHVAVSQRRRASRSASASGLAFFGTALVLLLLNVVTADLPQYSLSWSFIGEALALAGILGAFVAITVRVVIALRRYRAGTLSSQAVALAARVTGAYLESLDARMETSNSAADRTFIVSGARTRPPAHTGDEFA